MVESMVRWLVGGLAFVAVAEPVMGQWIIAHRGASHDAPENTASAFQLAWQQDADGIEGDFYLAADNQIVCIHDRDTKRTAGEKLIVEESTLSQLRKLEYGGWKSSKFSGEPIPTLDEVIATVPDGKRFVVELKSDRRIIPKLIETLIRHQNKPIEFVVITFDAASAGEFKKRMPSIKTHWLTSFKRSTPLSTYRPTAAEIAATVARAGVDGVGMKAMPELIDDIFIDELRAGGCKEFHVWTVDEVDTAKHFQALGTIGITTNVPAVIKPALMKPAMIKSAVIDSEQ